MASAWTAKVLPSRGLVVDDCRGCTEVTQLEFTFRKHLLMMKAKENQGFGLGKGGEPLVW